MQGADDSNGTSAHVPVTGNRTLKVLTSRHQAGAIIGRKGEAVNELQTRSGARIKVSHTESTFPETQLRIVMLEGSADALNVALRGIIETCFLDAEGPEGQIMLAVPSAAAPVIIGKGGANIEEMGKRTGTNIRMSNRDREIPGVKERIATVKGPLEGVIAGCVAIVDEMHRDARFATYDNPSTNYDSRHGRGGDEFRGDSRSRSTAADARGGQAPPRRRSRSRDRSSRSRDESDNNNTTTTASGSGSGKRSSRTELVPNPSNISVQVSLPDDLVGLMLGRGGENLAQIQSQTHTKISVSRRGEYVEGTRDRIVTIAGLPADCDLAREMLAKRVLEKQQQQQQQQQAQAGAGGM